MCTSYALPTHFDWGSSGGRGRSLALSATMARTWERYVSW